MQAMTNDEVKEFIRKSEWATGIKIDGERNELYYDTPNANCMDLGFPEKPLRVPYFARVLSMLTIDREELFCGAVLWLTLWDIGSPQLEKSGWKSVEKMRLAFGETRPIGAAPGHSFRSDELVELNAFLLPCFIFGWDAYLLPASSNDYFVHISHDEYWTIAAKSQPVYDKLFNDLNDIKPQAGGTRSRAEFCRSMTKVIH